VSISPNGYVCLGNNSDCGSFHILIGLHHNLDPSREGSGQIYYKNLDSNSLDFRLVKIYLNLFNPEFEPNHIFMITYDNMLPHSTDSNSITSFRIYLSTDLMKSFVTFKFKSCPKDLDFYSSSSLVYTRIDGSLKGIKIFDGQQCIGSNVGQTGVWVSEVTTKGKLKKFYPKYSLRGAPLFRTLKPIISKSKKDILIR
jgi:hypothetical protein